MFCVVTGSSQGFELQEFPCNTTWEVVVVDNGSTYRTPSVKQHTLTRWTHMPDHRTVGGKPLVSVVIPAKNRADLLEETLNSLRRQKCSLWEAVVVDDCSDDDTNSRLMRLAQDDPRVRPLMRQGEAGGAQVCRNQGMAAARGSYIIFLDSDDLLAASCLERRLEVMEASPNIDFAVFRGQMFKDDAGDLPLLWNYETDEDDFDRLLRGDVPWQTSAPIWRLCALQRVGEWDTRLLCSQDQHFHMQALLAGLKYKRNSEIDHFIRVADASRTTIGQSFYSQRHLDSQRTRLNELYNMLKKAEWLQGYRGVLLAGNYFWLCNAYAQSGWLRPALTSWRECLRYDLISRKRYWEGYAYLRLRRHWCSALPAHYITRHWPEDMFVFNRLSLRNAPIDAKPLGKSPSRDNLLVDFRNHEIMVDGPGRYLLRRLSPSRWISAIVRRVNERHSKRMIMP